MTELEQMQRFIRVIASLPPHVQEALEIFLEWQLEQNGALAAPPNQE
jgi:hypothetical protein